MPSLSILHMSSSALTAPSEFVRGILQALLHCASTPIALEVSISSPSAIPFRVSLERPS